MKNKTASLDLVNYIKSLVSLMKPRVMSLVIFTCAVGLLTSNSNINISDAMIGIILVAMGAGAAGCLNMWYESDIDALMTRTCLRPIPSGK
ncbi:MAG: UbiA family prenyltransferase, partial [Alphaproteobacteria bacterium]|nr:UbiA family prenyltransferase [Alphaproteobacteria bacterium]